MKTIKVLILVMETMIGVITAQAGCGAGRTIGANLIKELEGFHETPYRCSAGHQTIGYGFTEPKYSYRTSITRSESDRIVDRYASELLTFVRQKVGTTKLTSHQEGALVSFVYNIGRQAFVESTALKRIREGNLSGVPDAMRMWNKVTVNGKKQISAGLVTRREREIQVWNS